MTIALCRSSLVLGTATAALALPTAAAAQESRSEREIIIVTAQRANQTGVTQGGSVGILGDKPAEDVPFTIKSYNEALILNQQPQTLGEVLENDPSVRTTFGFGNAAELFVIRGFALAGDDVGLDGLYGIAPRQLIAPELYDSVQVLNGASAFLNGAAPGGSALGGSVNLIPKRARSKPLTRATVGYTSDEHIGGSFDVGRRFGANGEWGVRINGAARRGDVAIEDEFRSTYTLGGAFDYDGGPLRLSLDLAYQRVRVRQLRPKVTLAVNAIPEVPEADVNYGQPFTFTTLRDVFGTAKAEYDLSKNALLYASVGARDGSEDGIYGGITVTDALTGAATGSALFVPRTDNNEAAQAGLRVKLDGGISHEINFGGSAVWQVNRNAFDFLGGFSGYPTNLYDPVAVPEPPTGFVGGDLDDPFPISRTRLWSVFASDTVGLWDDRILVTGGLRLQSTRLKNYNYADRSLAGDVEDDAVTPVVGAVVKPGGGLSLYANRIEGIDQPLTAPLTVGGTIPVANAGQLFVPQRTRQYEAGAKLARGAWNASLALFQIDRARPSATLLREPAVGDPGLALYTLDGEQRNRGIEFSIDGEFVQGLRVIAGGSIIDAELRRTELGINDGNDAPGVPEYLLNANVEWDLPFVPGLTLTGRVVHTGEQAANAANTLELPDWTRFDLGARFVTVVAERPLTLRFNVDNVANERYWASAFEVFRADLLQGTPRTFKVSASIEL